ncbi:MAG: hypothetical protein ABL930_06150 [Pseudobdellovibrio sp.]
MRRVVNLALLILVLSFAGCSMPEAPTVDKANRSVTFNHTNYSTSCVACHEPKRPLILTGSHNYNHTSTAYNGQGDCVNCHSSSIGVTWSGGTYDHNPQPTNCLSCHLIDRPSGLAGTSAFNHSQNGTGDCFGCHNTVTKYKSINDWAGTGQALPGALVGSRNISVSIGTPSFTSTTINNVSLTTVSLPLQMLHSSFEVPTGMLSSCVTCHSQAASGNYSGGVFHSALTATSNSQPTSCNECHSSASPIGFVGPINNTRSPASAEMRHEATTWSATANSWSAGTTPIVNQDCATCHTNTSNFGNANYHANLGASQPSSCLACHANSRPTTTVGTPPFNHQNNGGMGDCNQCHNSSTVWSGGQFSHSGVTSCNSCHSSERPTTSSGWVTSGWTQSSTTFSLATHGGTTDCYTCHSSTTTFNNSANWAGGHKNHSPRPSECVSCHIAPVGSVGITQFNHSQIGTQDCTGCHTSNANYTTLNGWAGASSTPVGLVNADSNLFSWSYVSVNIKTLVWNSNYFDSTLTSTANVKHPLQMLHTSPVLTTLGVNINSCSDCHTVGTTASSGTQFHESLTRLGKSQPTNNCTSCHAPAAVPTGIVGPKTGATDITVNMNHASTTTTECSSCHTGTSVGSFKNANFHANVNAASVTSCTSCHFVKAIGVGLKTSSTTYTASNGMLFPQHFTHSTKMLTQDCVSCHLQKGPGPANPWVTTVNAHSQMPAASLTTCNDCHGNATALDRPNTTTWYPSATANNRYLHTSTYGGLNDCQKCHTKKETANYTDLTKVGVSWNNGLYNHLEVKTKDKTSTCVACHTGTSAGYFNHNSASVGLKSQLKNPCMTCHSAAPAF